MSVRLYHNPRCSKSRETLALLRERGIEPEIVEYLKTPPTAAELEDLLTMLELEPRGLMRRKETAYRELGLDEKTLGRAALVEAMHTHPALIERPILVHQRRAVIGRPPQRVLEIL